MEGTGLPTFIIGKYLQETLGMSPMASSRALKVLAERGVLKESLAYDEGNAIASVRITHPMATSNDVPR